MPVILADKNLPMVSEYFSGSVQVQLFTPPLPTTQQLKEADILLVRTVTRVDAKLLKPTKVRFVGTASSGMNHINTEQLRQLGISCANAAGCNAQAVAEYVLSTLSTTLAAQHREIAGTKVGIVGYGNVGKKLAKMLQIAGATCLLNDPPLAETDHDTEYLPLAEILNCDVISLHPSLTYSGRHPSVNLLDSKAIQSIAPGTIVINTSRAEVIDEQALCERAARKELTAIIDVWQNEPAPRAQHIAAATVATPHIAGYSRNAKHRAVAMLAAQAAQLYPEIEAKEFSYNSTTNEAYQVNSSGTAAIAEAARTVCDPYQDSSFLHQLEAGSDQHRGEMWAATRNSWPLRTEFCQQKISSNDSNTTNMLSALGFIAADNQGT